MYLGFKAHLEKLEALVQWVFFSEYFEVGRFLGVGWNVHLCEPSSQTVPTVTSHGTDFCTENLAIKPFIGWKPAEKVFPFSDVCRGFLSSCP